MTITIHAGDCRTILPSLPSGSVRCCVCSPPYWALRDYGIDAQIGLEATPEEYVAEIVSVFREVRRVLADDGTLWLNLGDTYARGRRGEVGETSTLEGGRHNQNESRAALVAGPKRSAGVKPKDLVGIPWAVAFALRDDGWYLRSDIVWHKPSAMPESVIDRPSRAHEYVFLFAKSRRYFYDADAIRSDLSPKTLTTFGTVRRVPEADERLVKAHRFARSIGERKPRLAANGAPAGANARSVWSIASEPYPEAHYATFPPALVEPCVLAGSAVGDTVLDPFAGSGTTGMVVDRLGRHAVLIDLNPVYAEQALHRVKDDAPLFVDARIVDAQNS